MARRSELKKGSLLTITPRTVAGSATLISTDFSGLAREVEPRRARAFIGRSH